MSGEISQEFNKVGKKDVMEIYTDGAAGGNPGKGAGAFIFVLNEEVINENSFYLGDVTNNQAEYRALLAALDEAIGFTRWKVKVFSDSDFMIKQLKGEWRIKDPVFKELFREVGRMERGFSDIEYFHVPRDNKYIKIADNLCEECIKYHTGE